MLTSEVGEAFSVFREDYESLKILSILDRTVHLINQKGKVTDQNYAEEASSIIDQAAKILRENSFQYLPSRLKNLIGGSKYEKAIPDTVAVELINGISQSQTEGMTSFEAKVLADTARTAITEMGAYLLVLSGVGLPVDRDYKSDVSISIYLPSDVYQDDLGLLADKLDRFDKFLSAISEFLPNEDKPQLTAVSDGSFLAILAAGAPVVNAVAKAWSAVMQAAIDTIRLKTALDQMRAIGMAADLVEAQGQLIDRAVLKQLHDSLDKQFAMTTSLMTKGDANASLVKLKTTTTVLIEDARKGTRLTLQVSAEASKELLAAPTDQRQIDLVKVIENQQAQNLQIEDLRRAADPPLQLPPPSGKQ